MVMEENIIVIRDLKTFYTGFDWPKDVDENLKYENEFIIKSNKSEADNKMKNRIEQLLSDVNIETLFLKKENGKRMNHIIVFRTCHKD